MRGPRGRLYLLHTPHLCRRDPMWTLGDALAGGVDMVQWRAPAGTAGIEEARDLCRARSIPFVVNDDVELAVRIAADGAHVGQRDMPAAQARRLLGPDRWLGVSTRDAGQIAAAHRAGADHVGLGPCFPTETKGYTEALPRPQIREAVASSDLPVFAIGGIDARNLGELSALGVRRIAVSSAILDSDEPRQRAAELVRALLDGDAAHTNSIASPNE